ncbi:helix-turn-helix domain-containing protein [Kribbella pittospori]|uniref:Helix-turn-helix domain-containing protein n=1 Tax=Kribbella pittospori TaxID=722689 RepID=A0A4R0L361_9ACTN|nr:helix-turn-helix domain-containing protein [Kribbella pittospori]TCC63085.1 helix-turn-helix domain-containing protein [Kribbella pittospori]
MSIVFSADDQPLNARADYWHHVVGDSLGRLDLAPPATALDARDQLRIGDLGPVRVIELSTGESSQAARKRSHISSSDPELCKIDVQARGRGVIAHSGREARCAPGDFALVDLLRPCSWANGPSAGIVAVTFPRALLPLSSDDLAELAGVRMRGSDGFGALVSSFARQLPGQVDDLAQADAARLGTTMLDLLTVTLARRLGNRRLIPSDSRRRTLVVQIQAYIEEHLADPALSPRMIADAHYISVRYLHKLFETEPATVVEHIRRLRLDRCRHDLLDPALRSLPVSAIGARWGFPNPSHFSRLFSSTFSLPPVELRRLTDDRWS